jgi:hypothetical protein
MTTASVYILNQTNLTAQIMINEGSPFTIAGTSDSTKWMPNISVQTFQSRGRTPGNFNLGQNVLLISLGNNQAYIYHLAINNENPGSIQLCIFFYDPTQSYAGIMMFYEGQPLTMPPTLTPPAPVPSATQLS